MSSSSDYEKFVVDIIARTAPDVIRLSDSHAKYFLPLVCHPTSGCYIVVEIQGGNNSILPSQVIARFPPNLWSIKQLTPSRRFSGRLKSCILTFVAKLL